jgi:hypothetical protein
MCCLVKKVKEMVEADRGMSQISELGYLNMLKNGQNMLVDRFL